MTSVGVVALSDDLQKITAPEILHNLAGRARALAATNEPVGALCMAHAVILLLANRADDALDPEQWRLMQRVCASLADLLRRPDVDRFDAVGRAWLDLTRPSALQ